MHNKSTQVSAFDALMTIALKSRLPRFFPVGATIAIADRICFPPWMILTSHTYFATLPRAVPNAFFYFAWANIERLTATLADYFDTCSLRIMPTLRAAILTVSSANCAVGDSERFLAKLTRQRLMASIRVLLGVLRWHVVSPNKMRPVSQAVIVI